MHRVAKLGRSRWPVLIYGETGTGKELAARAIHEHGPGGPFVVIDCSSLVGPLMESELFGYNKGAFTGAVTSKLGLIEMANGGTAFLDEIGELPLDLQAKLLRVLQEKEFRPVGGLSQKRSDFRVISATNRDLPAEVKRGGFRQDLYYRLAVITLRLPALRERQEDIPALVSHFFDKHGRGHAIAQDTLRVLCSYEWPGNIRELENCVQHMVAVNSGPLVHTQDLPSQLLNHLAARDSDVLKLAGAIEQSSSPAAGPGLLPLPEIERRAIMEALRQTKGDRATAALLLGIGRTTLYRKLKEYSLS